MDFRQLSYATGGVIALLYEDRLVLLRLESQPSATSKYQLRFDWQLEFRSIWNTTAESLGSFSCVARGPFIVVTSKTKSHRILVDTRDHSAHPISDTDSNISYDEFNKSILLVPSWINTTRSVEPNELRNLVSSEGTVYRYDVPTKQTVPLFSLPQDLLDYVPKTSPYAHGQQVVSHRHYPSLMLPEFVTVQIYVFGNHVAVNMKNANRVRMNCGEAVLLHYELR